MKYQLHQRGDVDACAGEIMSEPVGRGNVLGLGGNT